MKRRIELRIDELRLPAGSRGGMRVRDAIGAEIARLLGDAPAPKRKPSAAEAVGAALHERIAPHVPPPPRPTETSR